MKKYIHIAGNLKWPLYTCEELALYTGDIIMDLDANLACINQGTILILKMESTPTAYTQNICIGKYLFRCNGDDISVIIE
jgi:hypothetical protein